MLAMRIAPRGIMVSVPVFVSIPRNLNERQMRVHAAIEGVLEQMRLSPRTVGRSDHPQRSPLDEVCQLARRCSGGLILGFRQASAVSAVLKPRTMEEETCAELHWPSPWNHLEAGILYALGAPLLVFAERGVSGGIFDPGIGNLLIHEFSSDAFDAESRTHMAGLIRDWTRRVRDFHLAPARAAGVAAAARSPA